MFTVLTSNQRCYKWESDEAWRALIDGPIVLGLQYTGLIERGDYIVYALEDGAGHIVATVKRNI